MNGTMSSSSSSSSPSRRRMFCLAFLLCSSLLLHVALGFDVDQKPLMRVHHRVRRTFEGLEDNCYEKCSKKHPKEIGAFAFALGMMMGRHEGPFWDCFAKCVCLDPVPAVKKTGSSRGGITCPRS